MAAIDTLNNGRRRWGRGRGSGGGVSLTNGAAVVAIPLTIQGNGPGGNITGIAFLSGVMYCVSNMVGFIRSTNTALLPSNRYDSNGLPIISPVPGGGAALDYIGTLTDVNGQSSRLAA